MVLELLLESILAQDVDEPHEVDLAARLLRPPAAAAGITVEQIVKPSPLTSHLSPFTLTPTPTPTLTLTLTPTPTLTLTPNQVEQMVATAVSLPADDDTQHNNNLWCGTAPVA